MVIGHLIKREGVDGEGDAVKLAAKNTAQWSRNQKILQKETKQAKAGKSFAKYAEFLGIALHRGQSGGPSGKNLNRSKLRRQRRTKCKK